MTLSIQIKVRRKLKVGKIVAVVSLLILQNVESTAKLKTATLCSCFNELRILNIDAFL